MKQLLPIIGGVVVIVSLVVLGFTAVQVSSQRDTLVSDLEDRTGLLAASFKESVRSYYLVKATDSLQNVLDKFADGQRLFGLAVYDSKGIMVASSGSLPQEIAASSTLPGLAMDQDEDVGNFVAWENQRVYEYASPMHEDSSVIGALLIVQKADYIDAAITETWKNNLLRLFLQALLFSLAVLFLLRWVVVQSVGSMAKAVKLARLGNPRYASQEMEEQDLFRPLASEISKMSMSLLQARFAASQEARMRLQKLDTPWTAERLKEFIKAYLKDRTIFVVSHREPYTHYKTNDGIAYSVPASGMVTAVEPLMQACGGLWLAHGSGDADRQSVNTHDKLRVPPDDPKYTLKRVWLTQKEEQGFYVGFSNEALWPLSHMVHTRPIFRKEDWQQYRRVNGKFARILLAEIKDVQRPLILVQDFHFALLPQMIKKSRPDAQIGIFWHVPWPSAESFSICPWRKEILEGMLGADVIGFHTQQYCNNFMDTVGKEIESLVDVEQFSITHQGHISYIKPFPISIPFPAQEDGVQDGDKPSEVIERLGIKTEYMGLGVDRLDYTKGILERFKGIEFFFNAYPSYRGRFTFLQIAPPSREGVEKYRQFGEDVTREATRINEALRANGWQPIVLLKENLSHRDLYPLYRKANVCLVTSLHDGMNLVAKEFIAARHDEEGVLILSKFTGAARDLKEAFIINPYSAEETAEAIHAALAMPLSEQHRRMKKMRETVKNYNVYRWSAELIKAVASLG